MKVWSWRQVILRAQLEPSSKLLLLALSTYMNDHGEGCYPSTNTVAGEDEGIVGMCRKGVGYGVYDGGSAF